MTTRIRECGHGGYTVERGCEIRKQLNPCGIGYIMGGFMVYESCHCDTLDEAKKVEAEYKKR